MTENILTLQTLLEEFKEASVRILSLPLEGEGSLEADKSLQRLQADKSHLSEEITNELAIRGLNKFPDELQQLGSECCELEIRIQSKLSSAFEEVGRRIRQFANSRRMHSSYVGEHAPSSGFFIDSQS